jgi:hypothetical protein
MIEVMSKNYKRICDRMQYHRKGSKRAECTVDCKSPGVLLSCERGKGGCRPDGGWSLLGDATHLSE